MPHGLLAMAGSGGKSATVNVYDRLLDMILRREVAGGTVLQERRLAESLGVSRTPLREALSRLAGESLVVRQPNRTLVVCRIDIAEYVEILHLRRVLEGEATALAVGQTSALEITEMRQQADRLLAGPRPSADTHWAVNDAFHDRISMAAGNRLLARTIRDLRNRTRMFNLQRMPDRLVPGCQEHLAILTAIESGDREMARGAMMAHIDSVRTSVLKALAQF